MVAVVGGSAKNWPQQQVPSVVQRYWMPSPTPSQSGLVEISSDVIIIYFAAILSILEA